MGLISLEGMEFFAYHGFYDEEQKIGNKYSIDLSIETDLQEAASTDLLKNTINYEELYQLVLHVMQHKHRLLEHVGHQIIERIKGTYQGVEKVTVSVSKYNPPIGGICERARVIVSG
ncbi:dihydroneopterin aldolase [Marinilongibacter aquaticus]|uniref:dihydroneopterin aldolase n=1 Tax=Marinilongibacter aquaticus TaxID=2975157 RepID=UPI0021BD1ACD|nr:dihydroneopterin aldolase [Marinilongibacter aquaticus]UBM58307.1 dihydroneopterin aldolase [Marinilongibacter aquaticus]